MALTASAPLDAETEIDLVQTAQAGDEWSIVLLVRAHVRYLQAEARKYAAAEPLVDVDDLVSVGVEGLLAAISSFDPSKGARLLTHARPTIGLRMSEEVAATGRTIALPGRTLRKYRRAVRETESLSEARALAASRDGMDPKTFDAAHFALTAGVSVDATWDNSDRAGSGGYGGDSAGAAMDSSHLPYGIPSDSGLLGSRGETPEGTAVSRALASQALAALDEKGRAVVALAYLSGEELSDAAIALRLGVSRPTVTRLRNAALDVMRAALA